MAKTLGTTTAARVARGTLAPVLLVRLRTYSDRATPTLSGTFYFSTGPGLRYQWAGEASAQNHDPMVQAIGDLDVAIPHLTSGSPEDIPSKRLRIDLANGSYQGSRLAAVLRALTLENARVDVAQVVLSSAPTAPFVDVTGEESLIWLRGVVRRWGPISEETLPLEVETEWPNQSWVVTTNVEEAQPEDIGRRYPLSVGEAKRVPAIGRKIGWVTTLAEKIDATDATTLEVTDASGFSEAGDSYIGSEKISWTGATGNQLTGVTRGADSTTKASHVAGDSIVEITDGATWSVQGRAVSTIEDIYVENPYNGELTRVTGAYDKEISDTTTDSATTATVSFSTGELEDLVQELSQSPEAQDIGGAASYTVEQHPDAQYCDSSVTTDAAIHRRYAPIDGLSMVTRTNKGSFSIASTAWYSCGFAERAPFTRGTNQELKAYVYRASGTGDLVIKSSSLASGSGTTTYVSGTDWTASTDGVITITTTVGETGATDSRWWFESPSGSVWEVFEVWRNLDANVVGSYTETDATLGQFRFVKGGTDLFDTSGLAQDDDYDTGFGSQGDADEAYRTAVTGGFSAALYKVELTVGDGDTTASSKTSNAQSLASIWNVPMEIGYTDAIDDNPTSRPTFFVGDADSDGDMEGGSYEMDAAGYTATFATAALSTFTFWIDGGLAEAAGATILHIRQRSVDQSRCIVECKLIEIVDNGAPTASVSVQAAQVGYGLRVYADITGPPAPSVSPVYKAGTGNPIADPADVLRFHIEVEGGETIDSTSYDALHDSLQDPEGLGDVWQTTTLNGSITAASTNIPTNDNLDDNAHETGYIKIDDEVIAYSSMPGASFSTVASGRGVLGTTAAIHADLAPVSVYSPYAGTVLDVALTTAPAATITVVTTIGFPTAGVLVLADEQISYTNTTAFTFTGCVREVNGTTAANHARFDLVTEKPSSQVLFAGDTRVFGLTWREVAAGMAFECGANLVPAETSTGTEWKMLAPLVDGTWPAATSTITEWEPGGFVELGRDIRTDLVTRAIYLYDADVSLGSGDSVFRGALRTSDTAADHDLESPTAAEIAAVELLLGRLDANSPIPYYLLDTAHATSLIAGRDLSDRLRLPRLVAIAGVPWFEAYDVEVGDILNATPPWETVALKLRVIGYRKRFSDELVDLTLVEVT